MPDDQSFGEWLSAQRDRADSVGVVACLFAHEDHEQLWFYVQLLNKWHDPITQYRERHEKGRALYRAWREWRLSLNGQEP